MYDTAFFSSAISLFRFVENKKQDTHMTSSWEPWTEVDSAPVIAVKSSSTLQRVWEPDTPDTSRLTDGFSRLFFYTTDTERMHAEHALVRLLHEILDSFADQRLRPEIVAHWTHLIHLHDTDMLHLHFFMLMLTAPAVLRKLAAMTDPKRFCRFAMWLIPVIQANCPKLSHPNGRELAHSIRYKWTTMC